MASALEELPLVPTLSLAMGPRAHLAMLVIAASYRSPGDGTVISAGSFTLRDHLRYIMLREAMLESAQFLIRPFGPVSFSCWQLLADAMAGLSSGPTTMARSAAPIVDPVAAPSRVLSPSMSYLLWSN